MKLTPNIIKAALLVVALAVSACSSEDKHVYYSSVHLPTTISLYDPMTDKPLWVKDIPVGRTLELDFDREGEIEAFSVNTFKPATEMNWLLLDDESYEEDSGQLQLDGGPVVIKVSYRPSPEYVSEDISTDYESELAPRPRRSSEKSPSSVKPYIVEPIPAAANESDDDELTAESNPPSDAQDQQPESTSDLEIDLDELQPPQDQDIATPPIAVPDE